MVADRLADFPADGCKAGRDGRDTGGALGQDPGDRRDTSSQRCDADTGRQGGGCGALQIPIFSSA